MRTDIIKTVERLDAVRDAIQVGTRMLSRATSPGVPIENVFQLEGLLNARHLDYSGSNTNHAVLTEVFKRLILADVAGHLSATIKALAQEESRLSEELVISAAREARIK